MGFKSNASDPIIGVQPSDEETPVLKWQKAKKITQRLFIKERKSLSASPQGPKKKNNKNVPKGSLKDALCPARNTFQGAGAVKAIFPDEDRDRRDPSHLGTLTSRVVTSERRWL